jgi:membrane protease YdiL (CAAX protease family)
LNEEQTPEQTINPQVQPPPEKYPFWGYQDLVLLVLLALPSFLAAALITRALFVVFSFAGKGRAPELLAAQFLGYGFWFAALYLTLRIKYHRPFWTSLGWIRPGERFWRHAAWGAALAFTVAIGAVVLRTPDLDTPIKRLLTDRSSILLVGLAAATIGPLCEELAFRGFLLPLLVRSLGPIAGVIMTALPFALLHGPQYAWSWRHLLFIVVAGAAFGWMRYRSGSTAAATVMHAAYNLTFFVAFVFQGKDLPVKW